MNKNYIRNLCIRAILTIVVIIVISLGFAYFDGTFDIDAPTKSGTPNTVHNKQMIEDQEKQLQSQFFRASSLPQVAMGKKAVMAMVMANIQTNMPIKDYRPYSLTAQTGIRQHLE